MKEKKKIIISNRFLFCAHRLQNVTYIICVIFISGLCYLHFRLQEPPSDTENRPYFLTLILFFELIKTELPNLKSLTLNFMVTKALWECLVQDLKRQPWSRYFSRVKVEHVHFKLTSCKTIPLRLLGRIKRSPSMSSSENVKLEDNVATSLEELLKPKSLRFPDDEDFGLKPLFLGDGADGSVVNV